MGHDLTLVTDEQTITAIRNSILRLNALSKSVQSKHNFDEIEQRWTKNNNDYKGFWRGADIQVIETRNGETIYDWQNREILSQGYSSDQPCPTKFPHLISGILIEISDIVSDILDYQNKYAFYWEIHLTCINLATKNSEAAPEVACATIIYNQVRLLNSWLQRLEQKRNTPNEPTLIDLGWRYYFAFGRNVNHDVMLSDSRCPNSIFLGRALLKDYRFALDSKGYATVISNTGSNTIGVLWLVSPNDKLNLDRCEGVGRNPPSYQENTKSIETTDANLFGGPKHVDAFLYVSNRKLGTVPADGYIEQIIDGLSQSLYSAEDIGHYKNYLKSQSPKPPYVSNLKLGEDLSKLLPGPDESKLPLDSSLPFFAYGLFKRDQFGYESIQDFIQWDDDAIVPEACLLERDGLPLLCPIDHPDLVSESEIKEVCKNEIQGGLLTFKEGMQLDAYRVIAETEPFTQYHWGQLNVFNMDKDEQPYLVNCLIARKPEKGTVVLSDQSWSLTADHFFTGVIELAERCSNENLNTIECQAAYLMLWTALERIAALKFSLKAGVMQNVVKLGDENAFSNAVDQFHEKHNGFANLRKVFSNHEISDQKPSKTSYKKTIKYLYTIRSNISHRGKGGFSEDHDMILDCIEITLQTLKNLFLTIGKDNNYSL
mgnify:FL=1